MYRRILVAVDGSYTSNLALQEAFKLAKETKAKLHLVHVIDITPGVEGGFNPGTLRRMVREEGNELLKTIADLAGQAGVDADTAMLEEMPEKIQQSNCKGSSALGSGSDCYGDPRTHRRCAVSSGQRG